MEFSPHSPKHDVWLSSGIGALIAVLMLPILANFRIILSPPHAAAFVVGMALLVLVGYGIAHVTSKRWPVIMQVVKFSTVGVLNSSIDLGVLNMLITLTGIPQGLWFSAFKSVSFLVAVTNSYFWNKYWTFRATHTSSFKEVLKFFMVNFVGFLINVSVASFVVNAIGAPAGFPLRAWANIGAFSAALFSMTWNFIGLKFIVFKR